MSLKDTLTKKMGPAPVYVYGIIFILGLAWFLHNRNAKAAASQTQGPSGTSSNLGSASNVAGLTDLAYPMPYSSDVFVNIKNDVPSPTVNVGGPVITIPELRPPNPGPRPVPTPPPAPPPPQPAPPPRQTSISYTVQRGDTLWGIAQKFLGSGTKNPVIYKANAGLIEAIAHQHGYSSSGGGHWIFPGEALKIPV